MKKAKVPQLPEIIKVKIIKSQSAYVIKLPEYDVFTEADTLEDVDFYVNDLIYALFDVPKIYQKSIWYRPLKRNHENITKVDIPEAYKFHMFLTPEFAKHLS